MTELSDDQLDKDIVATYLSQLKSPHSEYPVVAEVVAVQELAAELKRRGRKEMFVPSLDNMLKYDNDTIERNVTDAMNRYQTYKDVSDLLESSIWKREQHRRKHGNHSGELTPHQRYQKQEQTSEFEWGTAWDVVKLVGGIILFILVFIRRCSNI